MDNLNKLITLNEASELLKISMLEVETYIHSKKLTVTIYDDIVYLKEQEVLNIQ